MAEGSRYRRQPLNNNRNYYRRPSSSSSSSNSNSSNFPHSNYPNPSTPKFSTPRVSHTPASRNWDGGQTAPKDNLDGDQNFAPLVGTCPFMCPLEEKQRRERLRDLAVFERLHGNPAQTSHTLAVKKFCRTITTKDVHPSDVRPISMLEETLDYLLSLLHSSDRPFEVVHDFIFDRTRSIRQDVSMQSATGDRVIYMYERMVKFHILSHHYLHRSSETPDVASLRHLNLEQLTKTLWSLFNLYEVSRDLHSMSHNEAEFRSIYLLLRLVSDNQGEPLSLWLSRISSKVLKSKEMSFARRVLRYYRMGNYKRFIYTIEEEASYLQYCIVEPYINEVRKLALSCVIYGGYKQQPYPLADLSNILIMKDSDVESLCIDYALEVANDGMVKGLVSTKQPISSKPLSGFQTYYPLKSERIERLCAAKPEL